MITSPEAPPVYRGPRQYEAEHFDFKDIEELVRNGCQTGVSGFWGQGYLKFGGKKGAAVRDTVDTARGGSFTMKLRYAAEKDTEGLTLFVNGEETAAVSLKGTSSYSDWSIWEQSISLEPGVNVIELRAVKKLESPLYLDAFVLEGDFGG